MCVIKFCGNRYQNRDLLSSHLEFEVTDFFNTATLSLPSRNLVFHTKVNAEFVCHSQRMQLNMISIGRSDVPLFLRNGSLYKSFDKNDNAPFEVPSNCFKDNPSVDSEQDLVGILQTVRFWGVEIPHSAVKFIVQSCALLDYDLLSKEFPEHQLMFQKVSKVKRTNAPAKLVAAIGEGLGLPFVSALHQLGSPFSAEACEAAATVGDLECLMYLHTEGCPWDERTTTAAATNNQLACLEYLLDFHCPVDAKLVNIVAKEGNLAILTLLHTNGAALTSETAENTLHGDHVECLRFLHSQGCALRRIFIAAYYGAFECLKYLHEGGVEWHEFTCRLAAQGGHLNCLIYAHTHGAMWDADCCAAAAAHDQLPCLIYLHENGCPWEEKTVKCAVLSGSWSCLQYAISRECPMLHTSHIVCYFGMTVLVLLKVMIAPYVNPWHNAAQVAFTLSLAVRTVREEYGNQQHLRYLGIHWAPTVVECACSILKFLSFVVCYISASMYFYES